MSKDLKTGIVGDRGDCFRNVAFRSVQARLDCETPKKEKNEAIPTSIPLRELDMKNQFIPRNDKGEGDHLLINADKGKLWNGTPCLCCQRNFENKKGTATRVVYFERTKPKFGGISVTADDYRAYKVSKREIPPWHPHLSQPWRRLNVPSVTETSYQRDFPPYVVTKRTLIKPKTSNIYW